MKKFLVVMLVVVVVGGLVGGIGYLSKGFNDWNYSDWIKAPVDSGTSDKNTSDSLKVKSVEVAYTSRDGTTGTLSQDKSLELPTIDFGNAYVQKFDIKVTMSDDTVLDSSKVALKVRRGVGACSLVDSCNIKHDVSSLKIASDLYEDSHYVYFNDYNIFLVASYEAHYNEYNNFVSMNAMQEFVMLTMQVINPEMPTYSPIWSSLYNEVYSYEIIVTVENQDYIFYALTKYNSK